MDDLVKRLRDGDGQDWSVSIQTRWQAAEALEAAQAEIATLRAELAAAREALHHIDALCPVDASGCTHAALSGLLYNIEMHAICALKVQP
jgi:hypothetical protein